MERPVAVVVVGLVTFVGALVTLGCGSAAQQATSNPGGEVDASTGTLVVRVAGNPRDIRYFINGTRYEPESEIEWWRDARIDVELEPGAYLVEAEYTVRAYAGDGETYRITTEEPVEVRPGGVTLLYANLGKDYRGVPKRRTEVFSVLRPTRPPGSAASPEPRDASGFGEQFSVATGAQTTFRIERSQVSRSTQPPAVANASADDGSASWRIRARTVERNASPAAALAHPDGGSAIRVQGSQVHQSAAPAPDPRPDANAASQAIEIRGTRVSQRAAPQRAEPPGADAPVQSIRIRGTQVEVSAAS